MELELEEFLEEIKIEMSGYEEIDEALINGWETKVKTIIEEEGTKLKGLIKKGGRYYISLEDETDIFRVVDRYFAAIDNEEIEAYWDDFSLL